MTTTRAAVLRGVGSPFEVEEIELADPGPGDVRVRLAASGVCHSDLSVQTGAIPFMFPTVLGHEGAGVVEAVGEAVTRVEPGDHVVLTWMPPCRGCYWCLAGQPMLCANGLTAALGGDYATTADGVRLVRGLGTATFAEHTLVPEGEVIPIDPAVPLDLAALVGCALSTGVGAVWKTAEVPPGSSVAVVGCGGVGLSVIQGAKLAGAAQIVAVDRVPAKLDMAKAFGATAVVDASVDPVAGVQAATDGRGADYVFEVVGRPDTVKTAFAATRRGGTTVLVGAGSPSEQVSFSAMELFVDAKTIKGCVYGSTDPDRDFPVLVDMVRSGAIDAAGLVTRRIGLEELNDAFAAMEAGTVARSVVVFDADR